MYRSMVYSPYAFCMFRIAGTLDLCQIFGLGPPSAFPQPSYEALGYNAQEVVGSCPLISSKIAHTNSSSPCLKIETGFEARKAHMLCNPCSIHPISNHSLYLRVPRDSCTEGFQHGKKLQKSMSSAGD